MSRLARYRTEFRSMSHAERKTLLLIWPLPLQFAGMAILGAVIGNWLLLIAAAIAALVAVQSLIQLRVAAGWRKLYESQRDRPRAENWRQN